MSGKCNVVANEVGIQHPLGLAAEKLVIEGEKHCGQRHDDQRYAPGNAFICILTRCADRTISWQPGAKL